MYKYYLVLRKEGTEEIVTGQVTLKVPITDYDTLEQAKRSLLDWLNLTGNWYCFFGRSSKIRERS